MKYLGVDWGLKKIGLAFSEGELASPFKSITVSGLEDAVAKVSSQMEASGADLMVIGKPEGQMGKNVEKAARFFEQSGLSFVLVDETLSTQSAQSLMREMGVGQKNRRDENAVAAAIILQRFLDEKK